MKNIIDPLPLFSEPRYDVDRAYDILYLDRNKNTAQFENTKNNSFTFTCPLMANLEQEELDHFTTTIQHTYDIDTVITVKGEGRGTGIFAIFRKRLL
jgi:hypothetical protein